MTGTPDTAPDLDERPRCPECGYTRADATLHGDHHLCSGTIPEDAPRLIVVAWDAEQATDRERPWWCSTSELAGYGEDPSFASASCPTCGALLWKRGDGSVADAVLKHACEASHA